MPAGMMQMTKIKDTALQKMISSSQLLLDRDSGPVLPD